MFSVDVGHRQGVRRTEHETHLRCLVNETNCTHYATNTTVVETRILMGPVQMEIIQQTLFQNKTHYNYTYAF